MKKLSLLFLLPILFFSCSSDDNDNEPKQDYTSFVFMHNEPVVLTNCVVAYLDNKEHFIKVATLGDLKQGVESKEIKIQDNNVKELYLFTDYISTRRLDAIYKLTIKTKNTFNIDQDTKGVLIEEKSDPKLYPQ